jgi:hypothetical protein
MGYGSFTTAKSGPYSDRFFICLSLFLVVVFPLHHRAAVLATIGAPEIAFAITPHTTAI